VTHSSIQHCLYLLQMKMGRPPTIKLWVGRSDNERGQDIYKSIQNFKIGMRFKLNYMKTKYNFKITYIKLQYN